VYASQFGVKGINGIMEALPQTAREDPLHSSSPSGKPEDHVGSPVPNASTKMSPAFIPVVENRRDA
jgi:hypothetical protein